MRVLPILFNTEMVKAILDGCKTCTRRIVKPQPQAGEELSNKLGARFSTVLVNKDGMPTINIYNAVYVPGDVLYVRETWDWVSCNICGMLEDEKEHCTKRKKRDGECGCYEYRADPSALGGWWHPSIHMPKEAARIWLKVKNVRVERLQDMTDDDARKEGCMGYPMENGGVSPLYHFRETWDSTLKNRFKEIYGWKSNPYVWVIEFERCSREEAERL